MTKKLYVFSAPVALLLFLNAGVLQAHNLVICKKSDAANPVTGTFHFDISGGFQGTADVAVGNCAPTIFDLGFTPITISEAAVDDVVVTDISFDPSGSVPLSFDVNLNQGTVKVVLPANDIPVIVIFTNGSIPPGGRWTGGGSINPTTLRVTHGFELHCSTQALPNNLEINWPDDGSNRFHLDALTSVTCGKVNTSCSANGNIPFIEATGTGKYNGVAGATISFYFTDAGEPGVDDFARYNISAGGSIVLSASGCLQFGNHQFHPTH